MTDTIEPHVAISEQVLIPIRKTLTCTDCSREMVIAGQKPVGPRNELWNVYQCPTCKQQVQDKRRFPLIEHKASEGDNGGEYGGSSMG